MQMSSDKRAIDKIYKRRDRYDIPDWQREEVWSDEKKRKLIDSILRGWKLPKCYFLRTSADPAEFEVVDGQQRLNAIFEFFDNDLELSKDSAQEFGGAYYRDLPDMQSEAFDDFEIEYDVIDEADEKEIKEFFQRLQGGMPLTGSEKLNSVHSNLREFVRKLAKHNFFKAKIHVADKRYAHFDIASKVAAIQIDGIDAGLRFDDLKETFESQASFSSKSKVAQRLREIFDYLDNVFPQRHPILRNRTIVQSFATLAARLVASGNAADYESQLRAFFESFMQELSRQVELGQEATDFDYIAFQRSVNANVRTGARTRQEIFLRKLMMFDPGFAELFDPTVVAESGLTGEIKKTGESIARLVSEVNSQYSSEKGIDLFKPTNKTSTALIHIGKSIADYDGYKTLIEDLYFVFHEGVGSRLTNGAPASFADVRDLRTALQHDLDHGKKSRSAAKMKKLGETFRKYSGATSPAVVAPERFPVVQANLLAALVSDLRRLKRA